MATVSLNELKARIFDESPKAKEIYEVRKYEFSIASKLVEMRKSCGLTQKQLAEKVGILQPQLARLESARSSPNLSTLIAIAKSVGYSVEINFVPEKTEKIN